MRTLGRRIIHLDPARGFAAESVAASVLYTTAYVFEAPISTTHTITSAVMGVGATKRLSAVRWGVARSILTAWVLTFPAAGLAAAALLLGQPPVHRGPSERRRSAIVRRRSSRSASRRRRRRGLSRRHRSGGSTRAAAQRPLEVARQSSRRADGEASAIHHAGRSVVHARRSVDAARPPVRRVMRPPARLAARGRRRHDVTVSSPTSTQAALAATSRPRAAPVEVEPAVVLAARLRPPRRAGPACRGADRQVEDRQVRTADAADRRRSQRSAAGLAWATSCSRRRAPSALRHCGDAGPAGGGVRSRTSRPSDEVGVRRHVERVDRVASRPRAASRR